MTQQEIIKTFIKSLDDTQLSGRAALDEAVKACTDLDSYQRLVDRFKSDLNACDGNYQRFLIEKCGIILDNEDTGAITGSDAGSSTVKTDDNILPADGDASYPEGSEFTIKGLTIYGIPDRDTLMEQEQLIVRGLYSWWIRDSLNLIEETYGLTLEEEGVTNHRLKLHLYSDPDSNMIAAVSADDSKDDKNIEMATLEINMSAFADITEDDVHGTIRNDSLDRTIAHELTHALMVANFNYFGDLPHWFQEGTAELIVGIDKARAGEFVDILKNANKFFKALKTNAIGTNYHYESYTGGVIFLRYLAKQFGDQTFGYDTFNENVTVDGAPTLNYFDGVTMSGSSNADTILNAGFDVTINGAGGDDSIKSYSTALINGGAGNDYVSNSGENVTVDAGAGDDSIENDASLTAIDGADGNDLIYNNEGANVTVNGGAGNDLIYNDGSYAMLNGGADDDTIENDGTDSTLNGGAGNDLLTNSVKNNVIDGGEGDDSISNSGSDNTINGDEGDDSISNIGSDNTINGGDGNDTLINFLDEVAYWDDPPFDNTLNGGAGDDIIEDHAYNSMLDGGAGNDSIRTLGSFATIFGSDGDDSILNKGFRSSVDAGEGNDLIRSHGDYATLTGGAGADTFVVNDGVGVFVTDFNADEDFITIAAGGSSVVNADGSIEINFKNPVETIESGADDSDQLKVIKKFMAALDQTELSGRAALDEAIRASSDFGSYQDLVDQFLNDIKSCEGNWNKFLQKYCGILLKNQDTGAMIGSDAGGSKIITKENIFDFGDGTLEYPEGNEFTIDGLTIYGIPDRDELTEKQQLVVKALYNYWIKNALDLIKNSFGLTFNEEGTHNHRLRLVFTDNYSAGVFAAVSFDQINDDNKIFGGTELVIDLSRFTNLTEDNLIDNNIHRTLAHELVHGVMNTNFDYYYDLPNWFVEGAAELIHGVDDDRSAHFPMIFQDPNVLEKILELEYSGDSTPYPVYTGGYIFLRYFARQAVGDQTIMSEDGYINNYLDDETIQASMNGSTIENAGNNVVINLDESGRVWNYGTDAFILGSDSVDSLYNYAEAALLSGEGGNDTVRNYAPYSLIDGGADDDVIDNYGNGSIIDGGAGNDSINNSVKGDHRMEAVENEDGTYSFTRNSPLISGAYSTIDGGAGDDFISNRADYALIFGGAGNDTLQNFTASFQIYVDGKVQSTMYACVDATLDGGAGNDIIENMLESAWLYGGDGDDSIANNGDNVVLNGDGGDDSIRNFGDTVDIAGSNGDDAIYNSGEHITIDGGIGEDTIVNEGRNVSIDSGFGNDLIRSSGDHATLTGGAGADTFVVTDGAGVVIADFNSVEDIISLGAGVSDVTTIESTVEPEADFISVDGNYLNAADVVMLLSGANADSIVNNGFYVMVESGGGDDSIRNEGYSAALNAGAGNDFILSNGDHATLTGGAGTDTFVVNDGAGVVIADYNSVEDFISIAAGVASVLNDDGTIEITIKNETVAADSTEYTPQIGVIKRFMSALTELDEDTGVDLDSAIYAASDGYVETYKDFVEQFRADYYSCNGNYQRFLLQYCGINLYNEDTGAITGADAGGTLKGSTNLIDVSGEPQYPSGDSFTVDGLTIYNLPDRSELTDAQQNVIRGLNSWWVKGSLDLINQSYGFSFNDETANHRLRLSFEDNDESGEQAAVETYTIEGGSEIVDLILNMAFFKDIDAEDRHAHATHSYLDRVLAHELTHAAMGANIAVFDNISDWITEGSAELVHGIDDENRDAIISYAQNGAALGAMLDGESVDGYINYAGGYIALRYMAKQFSGDTFDYDEYRRKTAGNDQINYFDDVKMIATSKADTILNAGSDVAINTKNGADVIYNFGSNVEINAGAGDDSITVEGDDVSIKGGAGNDYFDIAGYDVTVKGGAGNDTFNVMGGAVFIKDYSARKDQLIVGEGGSTVRSGGGIWITFEEIDPIYENDQLAALVDVDTHNDELSSIIEPTEIEVQFEESPSEKIFGAEKSTAMFNVAKRHRQLKK